MKWLIFAVVFLGGCGMKLTLPNKQVCRDKGILGARCGYTNEGDPYSLTKTEWDDRRLGQFCMSEEDFAADQLFAEQACEKLKGCDIEKMQREIAKLKKRLDKIK